MKSVTTAAVQEALSGSDATLIDVRPVEAYNGWRLRGEPRGGHIAGARSFPRRWTEYLDWLDIARAKNLAPDRTLILYGYDADDARQAAAQLERAGFRDLRAYDGFVSEWSARPELPMQQLARYRQLVSPAWLHELLDRGSAPEYDGKRLVVCHAHYRNRGAYEEGHIPGAIPIDTNSLESTETWNRRTPAELEQALTAAGIDQETTVVLYGRFSFPNNDDPFPGSSAGQLAAMRCAFIMLYAGVRDVRVLNGGLRAWEDAGLPVTTEETAPTAVASFGAPIPQHPEYAVDIDEAREILRSPEANLVSVRSWPEFIGQVSGYNYVERKGRIPGAVFGNCGSDAYHMENYRNLDHTTREYHEVEALWKEVGVTPDKHNAFYCGTGWRGSEAFMNAWLMGWPRVSVFDGGWFEWSSDERNPIETGVPG